MVIESNRLDFVSNYLCIVLLVIASCCVFLLWEDIPEFVAISYSFSGLISAYGSKYMLLVILGLDWLIYGLITILQRYPKAWNMGFKLTKNNEKRLYRLMKDMMNIIKIYICFVLLLMMINMILNINMNIFINIILIIILAFIVGYYLAQMYFCK